jgi:uncharacterized membrane protein
MFALLAILLVVGISIHFTDLESGSAFYSAFLPIVAVFSLIALSLWIVLYFHRKGINQLTDTRGVGGFSGFFGGSDGGS